MLTLHSSLWSRILPAAIFVVPFTLFASYIAWLVVPPVVSAVVPAVLEAVLER